MTITSVGQNYAKRMDRKEGKGAGRQITFERCTIEYIRGGISRASFKFCMGDKLREQLEGDKGMKHFSVHFRDFNVHIPLQIVILNNFENCRSPSKMKPCTIRGPEIGKNY
jgi:hypothetical protein